MGTSGLELLDLQCVNMEGSLFRTVTTDDDLVFGGFPLFDPFVETSGKPLSFFPKEKSPWL